MPTVSIVKGKGYARHNDRSIRNIDPENRSWNPELSSRNTVYENRDIRAVYHELFDEALEHYNAKQKRSDRQIKDYYEHISRSKQEKPVYEIIVQIGGIDDKYDDYMGVSEPKDYTQIKEALDEYNRGFQERNPNFKVVQQITHGDEDGMDHTHIQFVPVAKGGKRGLELKNSFSGALKEMGYTGHDNFKSWRESELGAIQDIMREHGLEFEAGDGRTEHLTARTYKQYKQLQTEISVLEREISETREEKEEVDLKYVKTLNDIDMLDFEKRGLETQIEWLDNEISHKSNKTVEIEARNKQLEQINGELESKNGELSLVNDSLNVENEQIQKEKEVLESEFEQYKALKVDISDIPEPKKSIIGDTVKLPEASYNALVEQARAYRVNRNKIENLQERSKALDTRTEELDIRERRLNFHENDLRNKSKRLEKKEQKLNHKYEIQENLNHLYENVCEELGQEQDENRRLRAENNSLRGQISNLVAKLRKAFESITDIVKAVGLLKYTDNKYRVAELTDRQSRLIDGIADYGANQARNEGYDDLANDINNHVGISKEIKNIVEPRQRERYYDYER